MKKTITFKFGILLLLLILGAKESLRSEFDYSGFLSNTKDIRRMDNFGTDFYLTVPPAYFTENQNNITIKLFVFSYFESKVKIQVEAKSFTENAVVYPNSETVFDILPEIAFPFTTTSTLPISNEELYKKSALRVTSDYPVAVYVVVSGNLQSEGYLALPVGSSGRDYVLQSFIDPSSQVITTINYPAMTGIVNSFNGNKVTVIMSNNLKGKVYLNDTLTRVLDQGDTWFVSLKGKTGDLSGMRVISDKPISVITANQIASVPVGVNPTNYLIEQEMPTHTWGHSFHIPRLISRNSNPIIKVVAKEANTEVYLNGQLQTTLNSVSNPSEFIELRPTVTNPKGLEVITSNKDIAVTVFHPGYADESANNDFYKPTRSNLVPYEQYAKLMLFNVSRYSIETEKSDIYLYLNTQLNADGTIPEELELGYNINNNFVWNKVNNLTILDKKEFKYQFNGRRYAQITIKLTKSGNYKLRSNYNFAAYIFGANEMGSFSFPAGLPQKNMISGDIEPPVPTYVQQCDGTVIGKTTDMPENETRANLTTPIFHSNLSQNYDKSFETIIPGITSSFNWKLSVRDKNLDAVAVVTFRDFTGINDTTIYVEYKAPKIIIQPSVVNFGNTKIGVPVSQFIKIYNNSDSTYKIKDIIFKYGERGFNLKSNFQEFLLTPKSEQQVELVFTSQNKGTFEDSVGVNNDCFSSFKSKLIASTGSPKILVTDIFFNDVSLPNSELKYSTITNVGENDLVINNWKLSDNVNFSVNFGREISISNPLIIEPNKSFSFSVTFNPKTEKSFNESITFSSDAQELDSICILKAKAIVPGIVTTSYDWQNVRLDQSTNPVQLTVDDAIKIKNTGKVDLTITKVSIEAGSINTNNFKINLNQLTGKTLKPNETFNLAATFIPQSIGVSELILKFESNLKTENISKLTATVVVPKIKSITDAIDFDTTLVNYPSQENSRLIEITNLSQLDWQYADILTITDLKPQDPGIVQIDDGEKNSSFTLNTSNVAFPVHLLPGEKLSIPATFSAKDTGLIETKLFIKSDALNETEIMLKGFGADRVVSMSNLELANCIGSPVLGICKIRNNSVQELTIDKVFFETEDSDFKILDDVSSGFTIKPTESKDIRIQYIPSDLSSKLIKLNGRVKGEKIPSLTSQILGKTNQYLLSSYISPVSQTAKIDEDIKTKIFLEDNPEISGFECEKFSIIVKFNSNFLKLNSSALSLGKTITGKFKIDNLKINQAKGEATFDLISLQNQYQISAGEFLSMEFHTYLPSDGEAIGNISATIFPENNSCYLLETSSSNVILNTACTGDLRRIKVSGYDYFIDGLQQNPINENKEVEIGIAFDGFTEVSIYNQYGTLCYQPVFSSLPKGIYSFNFDISNLSSGVYFIQFKSGEYLEIKKFLIEK